MGNEIPKGIFKYHCIYLAMHNSLASNSIWIFKLSPEISLAKEYVYNPGHYTENVNC